MRFAALTIILFGVAACSPQPEERSRRPKLVKLFDGRSLDGWRAVDFELGGLSKVSLGEDGSLQVGAGDPMAGVVLDDPNIPLPTGDYEIELEARIVDGNDFFCGLTIPFPSQESHFTLIVGGWGGTVVGISNVNGMDASINTTRHDRPFEPKRWYKIRVRVTSEYLDVWIDDESVIELEIGDRKIAMRPGAIEQCRPIGLANWKTTSAYRNIRLRPL